jgi:hypothetical protein
MLIGRAALRFVLALASAFGALYAAGDRNVFNAGGEQTQERQCNK